MILIAFCFSCGDQWFRLGMSVRTSDQVSKAWRSMGVQREGLTFRARVTAATEALADALAVSAEIARHAAVYAQAKISRGEGVPRARLVHDGAKALFFCKALDAALKGPLLHGGSGVRKQAIGLARASGSIRATPSVYLVKHVRFGEAL